MLDFAFKWYIMADVMMCKYTRKLHSQKATCLYALMRMGDAYEISHPYYNGCHKRRVNLCYFIFLL